MVPSGEALMFQPKAVTDVDLAFAANVDRLMPPKPELPASHPCRKIMAQWFYRGLDGAEFQPVDGVDKTAALRHITCILRSFAPKHEDKETAVAYLLSIWFSRIDVSGRTVWNGETP